MVVWTKFAKAAGLLAAFLVGNAAEGRAAQSEPSARIAEFENPLASPQPLQGLLRSPNRNGPSPAVVLPHGCNGKFRAAIAFYPRCLGFKGGMTVPTLVLIGELDDWAPAVECRNMVDGRDDWGISRHKSLGTPVRLVIYPGAYHDFDASSLQAPIRYFGHHLEFNPSATEQSVDAVREFLDATIGGKEQAK